MTGYTKLFGSILESTVWLETPPVKVVWITLLAMADRDGCIEASVPGLAKRAGVERAYCEQALAVFLAPDPDSRTKEFAGRRIEVIDGGWRLLNYEIYRHRASADEAKEKAAERKRRQRDREAKSRAVTPVTRSHTIAEEEAPAEAEEQIHKDRVRVNGSTITTDEAGEAAARFLERYQQLYSEHRHGAKLRLKPNLDWTRALELLVTWDADRLEKLAVILLKTDEDWIARTDRGFAVFAAKASWCDDVLSEWEKKHGVTA